MIPSPVIVLGIGRSGTSAIARILHERLRVSMGPPEELETEPTAACPEGSYEHRAIRQANIDRGRGLLDPAGWICRVRRLTEPPWGGGGPWGFKDPRASLYARDLTELFPFAVFILALRPLADIERSWRRVLPVVSRADVRREIDRRWEAMRGFASEYAATGRLRVISMGTWRTYAARVLAARGTGPLFVDRFGNSGLALMGRLKDERPPREGGSPHAGSPPLRLFGRDR